MLRWNLLFRIVCLPPFWICLRERLNGEKIPFHFFHNEGYYTGETEYEIQECEVVVGNYLKEEVLKISELLATDQHVSHALKSTPYVK